jgi:hypothetical protein
MAMWVGCVSQSAGHVQTLEVAVAVILLLMRCWQMQYCTHALFWAGATNGGRCDTVQGVVMKMTMLRRNKIALAVGR